ncbi:hypothetical protein [Janthinobacterium sp. ZB1P44]|uniref:hypothetical protein n=1 Tax=Janthinobacterium sp. ZB1P44 TaxID=3424192 RepID=UPI003F1F6868
MSVWRSARRLSLFMGNNSSHLQYIVAKIPVLAWSSCDFRHVMTLFIPESMMKKSSFICFQGGSAACGEQGGGTIAG